MIKQKILKFLIENKDKEFNIKEIANALKIDYKLIYTNIKKLEEGKAIKVEDLGNTKRCSFSNIFNDDVFIVENERKKDFLKNKNFLVIVNRLEKINGQFILLLFGSYAKGTETKHSDIDFLLISDKDTAKIVENEMELIPLKIHLTTVTYEDFIRMATSKEQTVVTETIKNNIILLGIEDYYRMMQNAG